MFMINLVLYIQVFSFVIYVADVSQILAFQQLYRVYEDHLMG